ncbi:hypothetical protein FOXB_03402, partial [Fusarium oxysporum f. sp. conglutinans Fo5176]
QHYEVQLTPMMIERALIKQSELNSFIQDLGLEADASKRVPAADILTSDDWKVLREVSHILEPIYNMTMRTSVGNRRSIMGSWTGLDRLFLTVQRLFILKNNCYLNFTVAFGTPGLGLTVNVYNSDFD